MTPEEAKAAYEREWPALNSLKENAIARGDTYGARAARRALDLLSKRYSLRFELLRDCDHAWVFDGENAEGTEGYFSCVKCGATRTSTSKRWVIDNA